MAGAPFPIWLRKEPAGFYVDVAFLWGRAPAMGVVVLVVLVAVGTFAVVTGRRALAATAVAGLVTAVGFAVSFALIPGVNSATVDYLMIVLWVEGMLLWVVVVWGVVSMALAASRALARRPTVAASEGPAHLPVWLGLGTLGLVVAVGIVAVHSLVASDGRFGTNWSPQEADGVRAVTSAVGRLGPGGPVNVLVKDPGADPIGTLAVAEGAAWQLKASDVDPGVLGVPAAFTALPPYRRAPKVVVTLHDGAIVDVTHTPPAH